MLIDCPDINAERLGHLPLAQPGGIACETNIHTCGAIWSPVEDGCPGDVIYVVIAFAAAGHRFLTGR